MKNKVIISFGFLCLLLLFSFSIQKTNKNKKEKIKPYTSYMNGGYIPDGGFVPDSVTAIKIAEAILDPIYGKKQIDSEKPFYAHLNKDGTVWEVYGYLPPSSKSVNKDGDTIFTIVNGGVAYIEIQKSDCKVLYLEHGK